MWLVLKSILFAAVVMVTTQPAYAHRLKVFATVIGSQIEGRVYFVGGSAAIDVPVTLTDSAGQLVANTHTKAPDGQFALPVSERDTFTVTADAQDGHRASFDIAAARFGENLPLRPQAGGVPLAVSPNVSRQSSSAPDHGDIDAAIARQIAPLADQIDAMQSSLGLRDLLGGIGYILGIFGLWALVIKRQGRET